MHEYIAHRQLLDLKFSENFTISPNPTVMLYPERIRGWEIQGGVGFFMCVFYK